MRILALHGLGASGAMLKEQLAPFMRELGPSYQFVFLDGAIPCGRGPAVPEWASGPFLSYTAGFTPSTYRESLNRLQSFIDKSGPFDGVLGFSMGAALAISYILYQRRTKPDTKPPFSFAVLFSSIFTVSADGDCYAELVDKLLDEQHAAFRSTFPHGEFGSMLDSQDERTFTEYLKVVLSMHTSVGNILPDNNTRFEFFDGVEDVRAENVPRLLHPVLLKDRVRVPTVHVTGDKDVAAMKEQSRVARLLCTSSLAKVHQHDGGHDIPFKRSDVKAIASSMKEAAEEGLQLNALYDL